jgi:anthranilate phosphoribosyltransferase
LGIQINQSSRGVEKLIEEVGIAFLYAPLFHPVMQKMIHPEKDLGIKTIFYTIIDSGAAQNKLNELIEASHAYKSLL